MAHGRRAVASLNQIYPQLESTASAAHETLASGAKFFQTFQDNPARRLMSLFAGAVLGLIVAEALGLDVIQATVGDPFTGGSWPLQPVFDALGIKPITVFPNLGTAVTGIAMGLGANPTHELVKALQERKQRTKEEAQERP